MRYGRLTRSNPLSARPDWITIFLRRVVLAECRRAVQARPLQQCLLRFLDVARRAFRACNGGSCNARPYEAQIPRQRPEAIHCVEVRGTLLRATVHQTEIRCPASAAGTVRSESAPCKRRYPDGRLPRARAGDHHAPASAAMFKHDAMPLQRDEHLVNHLDHFRRCARSWSPSINTSGSTIGTMPASCAIAA